MKQSQERVNALDQTFAVKAKDADGTLLKALMEFLKVEVPLPESLINWLAQLALLYGVPFNNLIADNSLLQNKVQEDSTSDPSILKLKQESALRFFYIDWNWINSLLDGALSIGTHNSKDYRLQQAIHKAYKIDINQAVINHRLKQKGKPIVTKVLPESLGTLTGLLFRSPVIAQWPGIEIVGYKEEDASEGDTEQIVDILRMERLAPDLLILIFRQLPKKIVVKEPGESTHSGFEDISNSSTESGQRVYQSVLRKISGQSQIGKPYTDSNGSAQFYTLKDQSDFRNSEKRVLNISNLREHIGQELKSHDSSINQLSPKDLAVNFINSPRFYVFTPDGKIPNNSNS